MEVAGHFAGQALAFQAQPASLRRPGRNVQRHAAIGRRRRDRGAERGFPGCDRQIEAEVTAVDPEHRVRQELDFQVQVASRRTAMTRGALARQPQVLAFANAFRNVDFELPLLQRGPPRRVDHRHLQRDRAPGALVGIEQTDGHLGMVITPLHRPAARAAAMQVFRATSAEECLEEVAEVRVSADRTGMSAGSPARPTASPIARTTSAELEATVPTRWRLEGLPAGVALRDVVVGCAALCVDQGLVRLRHFLEARLRFGLLADVGVVLARQLAVGAFDLVLRRRARYTQRGVVVLEFHVLPSDRCLDVVRELHCQPKRQMWTRCFRLVSRQQPGGMANSQPWQAGGRPVVNGPWRLRSSSVAHAVDLRHP